MNKVYIAVGWCCPRRQMDANRIESYFRVNGSEITSDPAQADHILYLGCGYIAPFFDQALRSIAQLKTYKGRLIVGGCLWDIDRDRISRAFDGAFFTTKDIGKLEEYFPHFSKSLADVPDTNRRVYANNVDTIEGLMVYERPRSAWARWRAWKEEQRSRILKIPTQAFAIRISDGCQEHCTYCSHRKAMGPYKSKSVEACVSEFLKGIKDGYRRFILTGMNTALYGVDHGTDLLSLIDQMLRKEGRAQFWVEELNPEALVRHPDEFYRLCKRGSIRFISCAIQSGSARILKLMNRHSDTARLKQVLGRIRTACEGFDTQLLVGFPSETESEFRESLAFVKEVRFDLSYINPYYDNSALVSSQIFPKNSVAVINQRVSAAAQFLRENGISYQAYQIKV